MIFFFFFPVPHNHGYTQNPSKPSFSPCKHEHPRYNHGCGLEAAHGGFGFSGEDFLPRFGQLERHQATADEGGKGQEDGDDLGDADEGGEDEAGDDGGELADAVEDAKRRASAKLGSEFIVFHTGLVHANILHSDILVQACIYLFIF